MTLLSAEVKFIILNQVNMNCLYCSGKFCNCSWGKKCACKFNNATKNANIVKAATLLKIPRAQINSKNELVATIMEEVKDVKTFDVMKIVDKYKKEEVITNSDWVVVSRKCEFAVPMWSAKCIHCSRPYFHWKRYWGDCLLK